MNKLALGIYYMPGSVPGPEDTGKQYCQRFALMELTAQRGEART